MGSNTNILTPTSLQQNRLHIANSVSNTPPTRSPTLAPTTPHQHDAYTVCDITLVALKLTTFTMLNYIVFTTTIMFQGTYYTPYRSTNAS